MLFHDRNRVPLTTLLFAVTILVVGIAFGGAAGYVVGNEIALRTEPVAQPVSNTMPVNLAQAAGSNPSAVPTMERQHVIGEGYSMVEAVNAVLPAVVTIINQNAEESGSGSGFFVSPDGYLVTNNHVIENAQRLSVIYADGGTAPATFVGAAPRFDLAVLKVDGPVPAVAAWGDSAEIPLGTSVIAIGSALGRYQNSVTAGVLSGFNRDLGGLNGLLQTDAAINQGNSGGPLINLGGEVIGINTLVFRGGFLQTEGLGFAIPSNLAQTVVHQLIESGEISSPFLGVQYQALNQGILLQDILLDTPASQAGFQVGDIIVSINGQTVDNRHPLITLLLQHSIGDTVTVELLRGDETVETTLTLGERT
jgi:2-alkenal reductase